MDGKPNDRLWILSGEKWKDVGASFQPRIYCSGSISDDQLLMIGGELDGKPNDSIVVLNSETGKVLSQTKFIGDRKILSASVNIGSDIYIFGGMTQVDGKKVNSSQAWKFSPEEQKLIRLPDMPKALRAPVAVNGGDYKILIIGGYGDDGFSAVVYEYDTKNKFYRVFSQLPVAAMVSAVVMNKKLYVVGGEHQPKKRLSDVYMMNLK